MQVSLEVIQSVCDANKIAHGRSGKCMECALCPFTDERRDQVCNNKGCSRWQHDFPAGFADFILTMPMVKEVDLNHLNRHLEETGHT